jgi:hypothetical protein
MHRRLVAFLFAFLLLGMQQEAQVHALEHFGEWLQRPQEQGLQPPTDNTVCAVCALFSGGSSAAPNDTVTPPVPIAAFSTPQPAPSSPAVSAPSFYLSRAPPSPL